MNGNHNLHDVTKKIEFRFIYFAGDRGLIAKSMVFTHKDIYKETGRHQIVGMSIK